MSAAAVEAAGVYSTQRLKALAEEAHSYAPVECVPFRCTPMSVALRHKDQQRSDRHLGAVPFSQWICHEGLRFAPKGSAQPTWEQALTHGSARARIEECYNKKTLSFYARLWSCWAAPLLGYGEQPQEVPQLQQGEQQAVREHSAPVSLCVVCRDAPVRCVYTTCGHFCLCENCLAASAARGVGELEKCPICRIRGPCRPVFFP